MPEIKNTFVGGKMNKDLDERLMPNGQYRDALNVEVSTAEGPGIGVVKNILGNKRLESIIPDKFTCVGSIADEKNNKLYWFITTHEKDAIIEYDIANDLVLPVVVDTNSSNSKAVLRFGVTPIITGINIIDNLLFWTDNLTDPKKINIDECKKGTLNIDTHTQLTFENGSFEGVTIENVVMTHTGVNNNGLNFLIKNALGGRYFFFNAKQIGRALGYEGAPPDAQHYFVRQYRNGLFLRRVLVKLWTATDQSGQSQNGTHGRVAHTSPDFQHDGSSSDSNIVSASNGIGYYDTQLNPDFIVGDILYGDNVSVDIEERHITVIKPKPLLAPSFKINHDKYKGVEARFSIKKNTNSTRNIPNLFETKFPRFAYRYKFRDGEFSAFSPFTAVVFNPAYPKDINNSIETNVFYNKDNSYDIKDPSNKAMANSIHSIELTDFITYHTPEDVIEVDILYKQENSSVIYSIATIKHNDPEWHLPGNTQGYDLGYNKTIRYAPDNFIANGGFTKGKFVITTENIYAALPANQLLRPFDNVPRRALAQEVTGNRVVYGNYLQNYNLGNHKTKMSAVYGQRNNINTFEAQGLPSIKSQRNYQLGVIYCDEHGRETPVFTSNKSAVAVPWANVNGLKNASQSNQLSTSITADFPRWVDSIKFYVKETSNEYYNLVMDRAWVVQKTYELDNSEGHMWISFPSSDRNKISEQDYIILKKQVGAGQEQVQDENKFKIIDISNEAPDAIKYELVNQGVTNTEAETAALFADVGTGGERPDNAGTNNLFINVEAWSKGNSFMGIPFNDGDPDIVGPNTRVKLDGLYVSWFRLNPNQSQASKKYKVLSGRLVSGAENIMLKLASDITQIDADIAHIDNVSPAGFDPATNMHGDIRFQIEKKEEKTGEDFSGSFFVKISKNQVTELIESGSKTNIITDHSVSAKTPIFWWRDEIAGDTGSTGTTNEIRTNDDDYGLATYSGLGSLADDGAGDMASDNSVHHADNNTVGFVGGPYHTTDIRLTDYAEAWAGIQQNYCGGNNKGVFFLDSMHMVAGQSEASNYAKYCCVTWSGAAGDSASGSNIIQGDSAWSYPPLKSWLGTYSNDKSVVDDLLAGVSGQGLLSTSPVKAENEDYEDKKLDGWVGHPQYVKRRIQEADPAYAQHAGLTHVNGLEGVVTSNVNHSKRARRWFSGITSGQTEDGNGVDTKTYSNDDEEGRHFMHLSFFAPGKDLTGDASSFSDIPGSFELFGERAVGNRLQGIWGGGHFTGENPSDVFGAGTVKHSQICMEGNYDDNGGYLDEPPGPGVGFGYDIRYKELHERQWDPTFPSDPNNRTRDFIRKLHTGSQFKFKPNLYETMSVANKQKANETIYTIKSVSIKKLYNHTSWRNTFNRWEYGEGYKAPNDDRAYWSVERATMNWLTHIKDNGIKEYSTQWATDSDLMRDKLIDFGASHNRRLCYIIELDKDPDHNENFNPIQEGMGVGLLTADLDNNEFHNIEFLEKTKKVAGVGDLNKFPAIWETSPEKQEVDLDIYFEASSNIPVRLNERTNEILAPLGCFVELVDAPVSGTSYLIDWNGFEATFEPGFPLTDGTNEIDYSNASFKFIKGDGGYVTARADTNILTGFSNDPLAKRKTIVFREDIAEVMNVGLAWNNCFSFGNGLESNRIQDDFNKMFMQNGVRASITTQQTYEEERRSTGLIYSGLYNSNSGINDLNQFIMAEKITKDLNPTFGSIQKLFQRRISLVAFCEDRVVSIMSNKDAIYNADGNPQLISSNNVLGDANPFEGNFGISKNPESFASESYRAYFTDKNRGAVIRLSKDGLTPISSAGMHDWFRDNLTKYDALIGSFDSYKEDYNITLSDSFGENLLFNSKVSSGVDQGTVSGGFVNNIENPSVYNGDNMTYPYQSVDMLDHVDFTWGSNNSSLLSTGRVTNHAEILVGGVYEGQSFEGTTYNTSAYSNQSYSDIVDESTPGEYTSYQYNYDDTLLEENGGNYTETSQIYLDSFGITFTENLTQVSYNAIVYDNKPSYVTGFGNIADSGILFSGIFDDGAIGTLTLFESDNNTPLLYGNRYCNPTRRFRAGLPTLVYPNNSVLYYNLIYTPHPNSTYITDGTFGSYNSTNEVTGFPSYDSGNGKKYLLGWIFKTSSGRIIFNKLWNSQDVWDDWVEFRDLGFNSYDWDGTYSQTATPLMNQEYDTAVSNSTLPGLLTDINDSALASSFFDPGNVPNSIYNGEEIKVTLRFRVPASYNNSPPPMVYNNSGTTLPSSFNHIIPRIELRDGPGDGVGTVIPPNVIKGVESILTFPSTGGFKPHGSKDINNENYNANFSIQTNAYTTNLDLAVNALGWSSSGTLSYDFEHLKGFSPSSIVDFPLTHFGPTPTATNSGYGDLFDQIDQQGRTDPNVTHAIYSCSVYFKFTDPNQSILLPTNGIVDFIDTSSIEVESRIVVQDLVVRVGQVNPDVYTSYWPLTGTEPLKPQWEIISLDVEKVVNVTAPQSYLLGGISSNTDAVVGNTGTPGVVDSNGQPFIDKIPTDAEGAIPAWTEVQNMGINGWASATMLGTNNSQLQQEVEFGNTYSGLVKSREAGGQTYNWLEPDLTLDASIHGTTGYTGYNVLPAVSGTILEELEAGDLITDFANEYYRVQQSGTDAMFDLTYTLSNANKWEDNHWYLIDVEFEGDEVPDGDSLTGTGSGHGKLVIVGVTNLPAGGVHGDIVDSRGVGTHSTTTIVGSTPQANIELVPTERNEYGNVNGSGDGKIVLRAIFKVHENSFVASTSVERLKLKLRFARFTIGTKITKIISKKLSKLPNGGEAESWTHSSDTTVHSLQKRSMYFDNLSVGIGSALMWENRQTTGSSGTSSWDQTFAPGNAPQTSGKHWRLRFKVSDNPNTESMTGSLNCIIQNDFGDFASGQCNGMLLTGITDPGTYEFTFNIGGPDGGDGFNAVDDEGNPVWKASKINDASWTPSQFRVSGYTTTSSLKNKIRFWGGTDGSSPLTCAVSEILLTDETEVLTGGTANSWSWNGFDDALESYIFWNQELGRIEYTACPVIDPLYNVGGAAEQISVSQFIELPIKKGERYKVSVKHEISEGRLGVYYYNAQGFGFRMFDIGPGAGTSTGTFVVGEYQWSSLNPADNSYLPELKSTFVIRQHDDSPEVNGNIDDITMMRQYDLTQQQPITVSFNERINGWTSFKSFVPESGLSLSKKYFTFLNGGLWQHYMPMQYNTALGKWDTSSVEDATNYNIFYNNNYDYNKPASITAVLNNEPSVVKVFNTLNYEGSQSLVKVPQTIGSITAEAQVTINNVIAWNNVHSGVRNHIMGWSCSSIQTDLEAGSVNNFIKKEGKWFGYIKGLETDKPIDTMLFSVQGIGIASSVTPI